MTGTRYLRPRSVQAAADALSREDLTIFAGTTDIYPSTVGRSLTTNVLDLTKVDTLRGIEQTAHGWRIGACTTWTDIAMASLPPQFDALKSASRQIGGVQIQNRGTVGGNLCTASPAGDSIPVFLTLSAEVEIASVRGTRRTPLNEFVTGYRQTTLAADEFVVALHVPDRAGSSDFQKLGSRTHLVISIAMVATHIEIAATTPRIRIAVGACSPVAVRLRALESLLNADPDYEIEDYDYLELSPIDDVRGSADYRRSVVGPLVARSVAACRDRL